MSLPAKRKILSSTLLTAAVLCSVYCFVNQQPRYGGETVDRWLANAGGGWPARISRNIKMLCGNMFCQLASELSRTFAVNKRIRVAESLKQIDEHIQIEIIKQALARKDPEERENFLALANIVGEPAVDILIDALLDKDPAIQDAAYRGLQSIAWRAIPKLYEARKNHLLNRKVIRIINEIEGPGGLVTIID